MRNPTQIIRVAIFPSFPPTDHAAGGAVLAMWHTIEALRRRNGLEVHVALPDIFVTQYSKPHPPFLTFLSKPLKSSISRYLGRICPDIVHGHEWQCLFALQWARKAGVPTVYEERLPSLSKWRLTTGLSWPPHRGWKAIRLARRHRKLAMQADQVIVPSRAALTELKKEFKTPNEKSSFAHNGVDHNRFFRVDSAARSSELRLINAGRITEGKNFDLCLRVYADLLREFPSLKFDIVGDGPGRPILEEFCRKENLSGVTFHGLVAPAKLAAIYQGADILLNASSSESFGNVVAEAMACGLPVVAFRVGSLPELVVDGATGYLCPYRSEDELRAKVKVLLLDSAKRSKFCIAGAQRIKRRYSWDSRGEKIESIYRNLLNAKIPDSTSEIS